MAAVALAAETAAPMPAVVVAATRAPAADRPAGGAAAAAAGDEEGEEEEDDDDDEDDSDADDGRSAAPLPAGAEATAPRAKSEKLQALMAAYRDWKRTGNFADLSHTRATRFVHMLRRTGQYDEAWALVRQLTAREDFRMSLALAAVLARLLRRSRNLEQGYAVYQACRDHPPVSILLRPLLRLALEPPVSQASLMVAMDVFRRMGEIRFLLSGDYCLMARALVAKHYVVEAVEVYEHMVAQKFYADDYVDLSCELIQAAFHAWDPAAGWRVYELARDNGIPLTSRALRTVIVLCLSDHNTDRALEVYTVMLSRLFTRVNRTPPPQLHSRTAAELVAYVDELATCLARHRRAPAPPPAYAGGAPPAAAMHRPPPRPARPAGAAAAGGSSRKAAPPAAPAAAVDCGPPPPPGRRARDDDRGKADMVYPVMYLMKIAAAQGDPDLVQRMMERLPDWRLRLDKAHHASLIAAYAAAGRLERAVAMLDEPVDPALGFQPTTSLVSILIGEAIRHGDLAVADQLATRATTDTATLGSPPPFFFVRLIILFARAGHHTEARKWYRGMRARGFVLHDARARALLQEGSAAAAAGGRPPPSSPSPARAAA